MILALAEEGFRLLANDLGQADQGSGLERLRKVGEAYLSFAAQHPNPFRIMFGPELPAVAEKSPEFHAESERAFAILAEVSGDGGCSGGLGKRALFSWSLVHGLAMLKLGPLPSRLPPAACRLPPAACRLEANDGWMTSWVKSFRRDSTPQRLGSTCQPESGLEFSPGL